MTARYLYWNFVVNKFISMAFVSSSINSRSEHVSSSREFISAAIFCCIIKGLPKLLQ